MSDQLYGFTQEDVARLHNMLREFESGALYPRPRHRAARLPWRYPSSSAYFTKLGASVIAGRSGTSTPFTVAQDTTGVNYGLDSSNKLDQITGDVDAYNYSKLPAPSGRLMPVLTDSAGTPFMMQLFSNFGIQCVSMYAQNNSGITLSTGNVNFTTWAGPNGASGFDGSLWYDRQTSTIDLKVDGDYFIMAQAKFTCDAGSAESIVGTIEIRDGGGSAINGASVSTYWRSEATTYNTGGNATAFTVHERNSSSTTQSISIYTDVASQVGLSSRTCKVIFASVFIMPCGFGETI